MSARRTQAGDSKAALLAELRALYREADALHASSSCPASTECCRFGVTGREPYLTSIEALALTRAIAERGGGLAPRRRALPITRDAERERVCPLLDRHNRCSAYAHRPLGCRTFYCDRATQPVPPAREALRALVQDVAELAARHQPGGEHARPLSRILAGTRSSVRAARSTRTDRPARRASGR